MGFCLLLKQSLCSPGWLPSSYESEDDLELHCLNSASWLFALQICMPGLLRIKPRAQHKLGNQWIDILSPRFEKDILLGIEHGASPLLGQYSTADLCLQPATPTLFKLWGRLLLCCTGWLKLSMYSGLAMNLYPPASSFQVAEILVSSGLFGFCWIVFRARDWPGLCACQRPYLQATSQPQDIWFFKSSSMSGRKRISGLLGWSASISDLVLVFHSYLSLVEPINNTCSLDFSVLTLRISLCCPQINVWRSHGLFVLGLFGSRGNGTGSLPSSLLN